MVTVSTDFAEWQGHRVRVSCGFEAKVLESLEVLSIIGQKRQIVHHGCRRDEEIEVSNDFTTTSQFAPNSAKAATDLFLET